MMKLKLRSTPTLLLTTLLALGLATPALAMGFQIKFSGNVIFSDASGALAPLDGASAFSGMVTADANGDVTSAMLMLDGQVLFGPDDLLFGFAEPEPPSGFVEVGSAVNGAVEGRGGFAFPSLLATTILTDTATGQLSDRSGIAVVVPSSTLSWGFGTRILDDVCDGGQIALDGVDFCEIQRGEPNTDPTFAEGFGSIFDISVERLPGDAVPEPSAALLFAAGFAVAGARVRANRKR